MTEAGEWLLTGLLNQGSTWLGIALFLAAAGLPLPATMLLMAAGAFARQGVLPLEAAVPAAAAGAVAGDAFSYLLGRFSLRLLPAGLLGSTGWQRATALFARWGGWSVFVTRFALTPVALPVNLLAGSTRYHALRFLAAAVAGEALWVLLFGGVGYALAEHWEEASKLALDAGGFLLGAVVLLAGAYALAGPGIRRLLHRLTPAGRPVAAPPDGRP